MELFSRNDAASSETHQLWRMEWNEIENGSDAEDGAFCPFNHEN
jgi:hypothetical protein